MKLRLNLASSKETVGRSAAHEAEVWRKTNEWSSVIFANENENGGKQENNKFVNENEN